MRALTVGYTYRPSGEIRKGASGREHAAVGRVLQRLVLFLLLAALPWVWASYNLVRWRLAAETLRQERLQHERLVAEWDRLTAEERVRRMVAPRGLFKPTEKEILRLP